MSPQRDVNVAGTSRYFNLHTLRRLFRVGNIGRGLEGAKELGKDAYDMHPTITRLTHYALTQVVPVGKGRYGSPVVEMSLRLMLAGLGTMSIPRIAEELSVAVTDRTTFADRLHEIANEITRLSSAKYQAPARVVAELAEELAEYPVTEPQEAG